MGVRVINSSVVGYYGEMLTSYHFCNMIRHIAEQNDVIWVQAAGNRATGIDPLGPCLNNESHDFALIVAGVNIDDGWWHAGPVNTSNHGPWVDVSAAASVKVAIPTTSGDDDGDLLASYDWMSGTSLASPIVAGVAGLMKVIYPNWTGDDIRQKIRASVDDIYWHPDNGGSKRIKSLGRGESTLSRQSQYLDKLEQLIQIHYGPTAYTSVAILLYQLVRR